MSDRIHIFGASGSGTTTLGKAVSERLGVRFIDVDDYYWKPTEPPFREKNLLADRIVMIDRDIDDRDGWVLSGSLCSWGEAFVERFTLAVFLYLDPAVRMERILSRERKRYADKLDAGGSMHDAHKDFIAWAASYDTAVAPIRSLNLHESWMKQLKCSVLRLNSEAPIETLVDEVISNGRRSIAQRAET